MDGEVLAAVSDHAEGDAGAAVGVEDGDEDEAVDLSGGGGDGGPGALAEVEAGFEDGEEVDDAHHAFEFAAVDAREADVDAFGVIGAEVGADVTEAEGPGECGGAATGAGIAVEGGVDGARAGGGSDAADLAFADAGFEEGFDFGDGGEPEGGDVFGFAEVVLGDVGEFGGGLEGGCGEESAEKGPAVPVHEQYAIDSWSAAEI